MSRMKPEDPSQRLAQLRLIDAEINARVSDYQHRIQGLDARAGVLISAAVVAVTLLAGSATNGWAAAGVVCSLLSAFLGSASLIPGKARAVHPSELRKAVYGRDEGPALLWLIDHKIATLAANERRVTLKARLLQSGFILFALAAFFILISTTTIRITI